MKIVPSALRKFVRGALARYASWRRPLTPPSGATLAEMDTLSKAMFTNARNWIEAMPRAELPVSVIGHTGFGKTPEPDDHELHLAVLRGYTEKEHAKRLAEREEKRAQFEREIDEERAQQRERAELWNAIDVEANGGPPADGFEIQTQHYFNAMTFDRPKPPTPEERAAMKIAVHAAVTERINFLRADKTVAGFARRLGVRHSVVARWCKGTLTPTIENLVLIARVYGVSLCWLAGENPIDGTDCYMDPER